MIGRGNDLTGQTFGRWSVVGRAPADPRYREWCWVCRCACGHTRTVTAGNLRRGVSRSCGCILSEINSARLTTHGASDSPEYSSWSAMRDRCTNPNNEAFAHYGGRGIRVCGRWEIFENFLADMGRRPTTKHSIDRVDVDGSYEPGNCRWATPRQQARNRRCAIVITRDGVTKALADWCDELGLRYGMIQQRIWKGMDPNKALEMPCRFGRLIHGRDPAELAVIAGVTVKAILWRERQGWSLEQILAAPRRPRKAPELGQKRAPDGP